MIRTRSKGFSLIELIIVLIIISLLTLLVTPSLTRTVRHMEVRSVAKKISSVLRFCRSNAVNKNKIYQVHFDLEANQLSVLSGGEGGEPFVVEKSYPLPKEIQIEKTDFGKTLSEASFPTLEFYPNGGSNGGEALVRSGESRGYSISVDFLTGIVTVDAAKEK